MTEEQGMTGAAEDDFVADRHRDLDPNFDEGLDTAADAQQAVQDQGGRP